jgi:hypothetical protein
MGPPFMLISGQFGQRVSSYSLTMHGHMASGPALEMGKVVLITEIM